MKKTDNKNTIQHDGVVQKADSKSVIVKITSAAACSGCHAEGSCTMSGKEDKIIVVTGNYKVIPGETVTVMMDQSMGIDAVLMSYFLPLLAVIILLIILVSFSVPELLAGLLSIAVLIPYYIVLYLFRNKIDKRFTFTIKA